MSKKKAPPPTPAKLLQAYKYPTILIAIGMLFSLIAFTAAIRYEVRKTSNNFEILAEQIYRTLDTKLQLHEQQISIIAQLITRAPSGSFERINRALTHNHNNFIRISEYLLEDNTLKEVGSYNNSDHDILYPALKSILQNLPDKTFFASPYVTQISPAKQVTIIPLIAPVPESDNRYVVGFINLTDLLERNFLPYQNDVYVLITSHLGNKKTTIYERFNNIQGHNFLAHLSDNPNINMHYEIVRDFDNHLWKIRLFAIASSYTSIIGPMPWITLILTLSTTMLIGYLTLRITTQNIKINAKVKQQTASLTAYTRKLEISNQDLDNFAHIASHDLKEPLRGIRNYSAILIEDYSTHLPPEAQSKLQTMQTLTTRMESLINSLLEYSLLSRETLSRKNVNIGLLAQEAANVLTLFAQEHNAQIIIDKNMPNVECDDVRVRQVFANLITNAIKYNDNENKIVEIGYTLNHPDYLHTPVFFVRDNGIGLAPENRELIFKIFRRLHQREKYGGGTGAGLTIARKIIERHNGNIWIETPPQGGSIFYFTLTRKPKP